MDKKTLVNEYRMFLLESNLEVLDVRIGAGGACLMYNVRSTTNDLDLELPKVLYDRLVKEHGLDVTYMKGGMEAARWNGNVDIHPIEGLFRGALVEGVFVTTVKDTLKLKKVLNRPKDQGDIAGLTALL